MLHVCFMLTAPIRFALRSNVDDPSQMRRGPTGTDRRLLSVATGD